MVKAIRLRTFKAMTNQFGVKQCERAERFHSNKMGNRQNRSPSHLWPSVIDKKPKNLKRLIAMVFKVEILQAG